MIKEKKIRKAKQEGKEINSGLKGLIEKSCWKRILKINIKSEGASSEFAASICAGVRKTRTIKVNSRYLF